MSVSMEILASQLAYAARPFAVCWVDSHFSGEFRFETFAEAYDYVQQQWTNVQRRVATQPHCASRLWRSRLYTPNGSVQLAYVLLAADVSSYN